MLFVYTIRLLFWQYLFFPEILDSRLTDSLDSSNLFSIKPMMSEESRILSSDSLADLLDKNNEL